MAKHHVKMSFKKSIIGPKIVHILHDSYRTMCKQGKKKINKESDDDEEAAGIEIINNAVIERQNCNVNISQRNNSSSGSSFQSSNTSLGGANNTSTYSGDATSPPLNRTRSDSPSCASAATTVTNNYATSREERKTHWPPMPERDAPGMLLAYFGVGMDDAMVDYKNNKIFSESALQVIKL